MKATNAAFHYGSSTYPVADANLPDVALVDDMISAVLLRMGKLSGGFTLARPEIVNIELIGDGYVVRFGDFAAEKSVGEALGTMAAQIVEKDRIIAELQAKLAPFGGPVEADRAAYGKSAPDSVAPGSRERRYPAGDELRCRLAVGQSASGCQLVEGHVGACSL